MDGDNCLGPGRYQALRRSDIQMEGPGIHIGEYRPGADVADRLRRGEERVRGQDHLVAGANLRRLQCEFQGGCS